VPPHHGHEFAWSCGDCARWQCLAEVACLDFVSRAQPVVDVADGVGSAFTFAASRWMSGRGAAIDVEVELAAQTVFIVLAVLDSTG